eukprot:8459992-Pyramimonas_sp.AAC.1
MGPRNAVLGGEPQIRWAANRMRTLLPGPSVELPLYGATNRVRGLPKWTRGGRGTACEPCN